MRGWMGLLAVLAAAGVGAQVYFSPDTGSHYEVIRTPVTWKAADDLAQARSHNGRPGHLASVTSLAEHQFLLTIGDLNGLWIGGIQKPGSSTSAGWNWTTAEVSNFTRWNPGEPNDLSGTSEDESHTEYAANGSGGFGWNDVSASRVNPGFIVEYSGNSAVRYSPSTGSWYQIVQQPGITLAQARQAAATRSYFGHAGRLATITTPFENRFVNFMGDLDRMWIGLSQPVSSSTARDDWEWDSGETFVYSNWDIGQPNNAGNNEGGLTYFGGWAGNRRWHDWGATSTNTRGVLIEFQGPKPDQRLLGWGYNKFDVYSLGHRLNWDRTVPLAHPTRLQAEILDVGISEGVVLASDSLGRVWTWGDHSHTVGRSEQLEIPTLVPMPTRIAQVDADWQLEVLGESPVQTTRKLFAASALGVDRNLWIWGEAVWGRTPGGGTTSTPTLATRPGPYLDVDMGSHHYSGVQLSDGAAWMVGHTFQLLMTQNGNQATQVWTDGSYQEPQFGGGALSVWTKTGILSPVGEVSNDFAFGMFSGFQRHDPLPTGIVEMTGPDPWESLFLRTDGTVLSGGGDPVLGLPPIAQIGSQTNPSNGRSWFALDFEGRLWVWGENNSGQLGLGPNSGSFVSVPVQVPRVRNLLGLYPARTLDKDRETTSAGLTFVYGSWQNQAPVAVGETVPEALAGETQYASIGLNDSDEANIVGWEIISPPDNLESFFLSGQTIEYKASANFSGSTSFTYRVTDGFLNSPTVTCVIPIRANLPPVAKPDTVQADRGSITWFQELRNNDYDPENRLKGEIQVVSPPSKADSFSVSGGSVRYRSALNAVGTDSFTYRCTDGVHWSAPTTVTIQITEPDLRKLTIEDHFQIPNHQVSFPAPGVFFNDSIEEPVLQVEGGSGLSLNLDGSFTYSPTSGYENNGRFRYYSSYRIRTSSGWSDWAGISFETTPHYTFAYPGVHIYDVNKGGVAVGYQQANFFQMPWNRNRPLEAPEFGATVRGINDYDLCVGDAFFDLSHNRPVQWGPDGKIVDLGTLGGPTGIANDVDEDGTIVGWAEDRAGDAWATTWKNGKITKIPGVAKDSEAIAIDAQLIYIIEELADGTLLPKIYQRSNSPDRQAGLYNVSLPGGATGIFVENKGWGLIIPTITDSGFTVAAGFRLSGGLFLEPSWIDSFGEHVPSTRSGPGSWTDRQGVKHAARMAPLIPASNYSFQWQSNDFRWEEIVRWNSPHFAVNGRLGSQMVSAVISPEETPLGDPGFSRGRGIGDVSISSAQGAQSNVVEGGQSFYLLYQGDSQEFVTFTVAQGGSALSSVPNSFSIENQDFPRRLETLPVSQPTTVRLDYSNSRPEGGSGTEIFTVVPALPVVALTVDLPDFGGDPETRGFTLSAVQNGANVLETPVTLGYNLVAIQKLALVDGVYDFVLKGSHWLAKRVNGVSVESGKTAQLNFSLINGDADGDNAVTVFDYIALSLSFGLRSDDAGFDQNADFDGDGEVTIFDYILLSQNFDLQGD